MASNRRLKQARELRGWSQAKVAGEIGTDATTVSRWERGLFSPTPYFRERLCALFNQNAEELGLLEASGRAGEQERGGPSLQFKKALPSFQSNGDWQRDSTYTEETASLTPPSWPKRSDTFSFILRSAMHDQQAHMLWGDAYVQALHGQSTQARQLGEASLNAFEGVGHLNATIVREWLNQRQLVTPLPPTGNGPALPPMLPEQHERPVRRFARGKGVGIVLTLLLIIAVVLCTGFLLNLFDLTALASAPPAHTPAHKLVVGTAVPSPVPTGLAVNPISTPVLSPTPTQAASPKPTQAPAPAFAARVLPDALTTQNCPHEPLGYRCTLNLWLSGANSHENVLWSASSSANLFTQFNPSKGADASDMEVQVIAYVQCISGQKGQLLFTLTYASRVYTTSVPWDD